MIDVGRYLKNKKRLKKAEEMLEGKWDLPKYAKWVEEYGKILEENLEYESVYHLNKSNR